MDSLQCSGEISMSENSDVLCDNHNINTTIQSDSFDETRIVDEMDSYMDDLSSRLTVSRIVTDSVIKGIVHAIEQEAADQIASRDAEIMFLNQKLQQVGSASLSLSEGREKRFDELHNIRQQLDTISKALLNCERGFSVSQYNFEGVEDASKYKCKEQSSRNGVVKENGSKVSAEEVFVDPSYLKHMDKDAVIDHFNKIMNEMKRQHDSTVQEKTEEIFALKRELLKKEGPNPGHFRNNKEFEQMRKKIWEVILKLDEILLESKKTTVRAKADAFPGQREKSNAADSDILSNKEGETCSISSQASHFAPVEADFVMQIKKLESDIEDGQIENITREEIEKIVVKEIVNEITLELHGSEMAFNTKQDICSVILNETVAEAVSNINLFFKNHEKNSCTRAASLQMQEIDRLKLVVDSFNEVVREKEEFVSEIEFKPMKACIDSLCHELDLLRHKVTKQDSCISEKNREFDIMMGKLEQALHRAHCNKTTLTELNDKFRTVSDSLQEVEQQNNILRRVIGEKEKILQLTLAKDEEFNKSMKSVIEPVRDFGKFISDYQTNIANKIQRNESRLGVLRDQCNHLVREGNLLRKKMLWYKEISETRGSNLQKAELEVDLLGDEVDALTDLLAKIYIALDHYSPVLQHYTGVMEILNMIKKQINIAK